MSTNKEKALGGEKLVKEYLESKGYEVDVVSGKKGRHWDLEYNDEFGLVTVEVKTTSSDKFAIVDLSSEQILESDGEYILHAQELWIVTDYDKKPQIYKITEENFSKMVKEHPTSVKPKIKWWINDTIAEKYAERVV